MVKKCFSFGVSKMSINCDNVIFVLKISKSIVGSDSDCLFLSTYVPPIGSNYYELAESNCLISDIGKCVLDLLTEHENVENIICNGDFNARSGLRQTNFNYWQGVGNDEDRGRDELYLDNRVSQDTFINDFGRKLLEFCLLFDLNIVNGSAPWDTEGKFTYISTHGNSLIDYFLESNGLSKRI